MAKPSRALMWPLAAVLWLAALAGPALAEGQLAIGSSPEGATVWLDGQYAGNTPLLLDAPAGTYRLRLKLDGHRVQDVSARVVDGLTTRRHVRLTSAAAARGELRVFTRPAGSALYLDGRPIGASPAYVPGLRPGKHRLVAIHRGHETVVRQVQIHAGLTSSIALSLSVAARPAPPPKAAPPRPAPPVPQARRAELVRPKPEARRTAAPRPAAAKPRPAPDRPPVAAHPTARPIEAPAARPAPVLPVQPASPFSWPGPREIVFWSLMLALLAGLGWDWRRGRAREAQPLWHPPRPARWVQPGATDPESVAAVAAMAGQRWEEGAAALYRAIETRPGTAWHYFHLGLALQHAGRLPDAETAYRTAIQLEPAWEAPHFNLAAMLAEAHQVPQAVIAYRKLLEREPAHLDALFNLGHLYHGLRMWPQAIAQWQAARKLAPRDEAIKQNLRFLKQVARLESRRRRQARPIPRAS